MEQKYDVVVIGNNQNRDWAITRDIMQRHADLSFLVLSKKAPADMLNAMPNVSVRTDADLVSSRDLLNASKLVWIATKPNDHFSGLTTLLMGMACKKVVIFDDPLHLPDYNLEPDRNCILVERGDREGVSARIGELANDVEKRETIGQAALATSRSFSCDLAPEFWETALGDVVPEIAGTSPH